MMLPIWSSGRRTAEEEDLNEAYESEDRQANAAVHYYYSSK
tara:strand:- start:302 stop:424 length:123 start_codon:yes stop_codon:yes gene_type:complete